MTVWVIRSCPVQKRTCHTRPVFVKLGERILYCTDSHLAALKVSFSGTGRPYRQRWGKRKGVWRSFFFSFLFSLVSPFAAPSGSPSRDRDVTVYILGYKPTEIAHSFYSLLLVSFRLYGPFNYVSFSVFSLCYSRLISALWAFSTTYVFVKISLNVCAMSFLVRRKIMVNFK